LAVSGKKKKQNNTKQNKKKENENMVTFVQDLSNDAQPEHTPNIGKSQKTYQNDHLREARRR
jgi:hypothetical protein